MKESGMLFTSPYAAMKTAGSGWVDGLLVRFSGPDSPDKSRYKDYFTKSTDFDMDFPNVSSVYYHHGQDKVIGPRRLTRGETKMTDDGSGVWIAAQLDLADAYQEKLYNNIGDGKFGWSSGTAAHLVTRKSVGDGIHEVTQWPLGKDASITPMPADPGNRVYAIKSLDELLDTPRGGMKFEEEFEELLSRFESVAGRMGSIKSLRNADGQLSSHHWQYRVERIKSMAHELAAAVEPVPGADELQAALARHANLVTQDQMRQYGDC